MLHCVGYTTTKEPDRVKQNSMRTKNYKMKMLKHEENECTLRHQKKAPRLPR